MTQLAKQFALAAEDVLESAAEGTNNAQVLVVAVKMPGGAIETITNHGPEQIAEKFRYYGRAYDMDDLTLKANKEIQLVGFMLV